MTYQNIPLNGSNKSHLIKSINILMDDFFQFHHSLCKIFLMVSISKIMANRSSKVAREGKISPAQHVFLLSLSEICCHSTLSLHTSPSSFSFFQEALSPSLLWPSLYIKSMQFREYQEKVLTFFFFILLVFMWFLREELKYCHTATFKTDVLMVYLFFMSDYKLYVESLFLFIYVFNPSYSRMPLVTNCRKLQPYQSELFKSNNFLNRFLKVRSLLYMLSYTVMYVNVFITKCLNNRKYKSESALFVLSAIFTLLSKDDIVSNMLHIFRGSILPYFYTFVSHIKFEQIWDPMNIPMYTLLYTSVCLRIDA